MFFKEEAGYLEREKFRTTFINFVNGNKTEADVAFSATAIKLGITDWLQDNELQKTKVFCKELVNLNYDQMKSLYKRVYNSLRLRYEEDKEKYKGFNKISMMPDNLNMLINDEDVSLVVFVFVLKRQISLSRTIVKEYNEGI